MKRERDIAMAMSLVGVFAIIATLGLLSLNQANTVEADSHEIDVGGVFTHTFTFRAPEELNMDDQIRVVLNDFTLPSDVNDVTMLSVNGTDRPVTSSGGYQAEASTSGDTSVVIEVQSGDANEISAGATVEVKIVDPTPTTPDAITDAVRTPGSEAMYGVSVSIDIDGADGIDHTGLAMDTINVVNMVSNVMVDMEADKEDVGSELEIQFNLPKGVGLSTSNSDRIELFLGSFTAGRVDASKITIAEGTSTGRSARPTSVIPSSEALPPDGELGLHLLIEVPDMSENRGIQIIPMTASDPGTLVTITFAEDSGIMNPSNGGMYRVKAWTSKASKHIAEMALKCVDDDDDTVITLVRGESPACASGSTADGMVEYRHTIVSTTPDINRVTLGNDVAGEYSQMSIRFVTDEDLTTSDTVTVTLPDFTLPDFLPPNSFKINGRDVEVGDSDPDTNELELPVTHTITAENTVVVTILTVAGIMNPATPGDMYNLYNLMVKTSQETMNDTSDMFEIMAAPPPPPMTSPTNPSVTVSPDTAGSASRVTVRFTTGDEGALSVDDEITVMLPGFGVPASIENRDVTVNGASAKSVATDMATGQIILTLGAAIPSNRTVSVVFRVGAGITNPDRAGAVTAAISTTSEGMPAEARVAIAEPPEATMIQPIEVVPQVPGEDSRITFKFITPSRLSSIENSEVIFRFHDDFEITGGRIDVSKVTIQANSIFGGPEVDTPKASGVVNPTSATVTYETADREPQIRLAVPDMADDEGDQHILQGAVVTVVFQQGSGLMNPSKSGSYGIQYGVNDANLMDLGDVMIPVVVNLSGDGGKRGTSVIVVAKGIEGGEAVLFWLDTATAAIPPSNTANGPDGIYDPNTESVLCRATAESNDTATCVFEVQNPPFAPGKLLWVNVQDSEGRRVGILKAAASTGYDWTAITGAGQSLALHPINEAEVKLDARVTISPSEVNIGDTVTVSMFDYAPGGTIEVIIGSVTLDLTSPGVEFRQGASEGVGQQSFTFVIPATVGGTPIPLGLVRVDVNVAAGTAGDRTADTNITIFEAVSNPLVARYDANDNGTIEKGEVIAAINDYLFGEGDEAISKSDVIKLINLYLFG